MQSRLGIAIVSLIVTGACSSTAPTTIDRGSVTAIGSSAPDPGAGSAGCIALDDDGKPAPRGDAVARVLATSPRCPPDLATWRSRLGSHGLTTRATMVNNRGHHSAKGSYSFFEIATGTDRDDGGVLVRSGDLFFGHFVTAAGDQLALDQAPTADALMMELIAWDPSAGVYNFYEMIGDGSIGRWFLRGDSKDIADDIAQLHLAPAVDFGSRLRCSACHVGGGPIMKELTPPYNDWARSDRPLPLHERTPDAGVAKVMATVDDADELADAVTAGIAKLHASPAYRKQLAARPLPEQLRPLFCPEEINFASSSTRADGKEPTFAIPSGFFVDDRLADDPIEVSRAHYVAALARLKATFPETTRSDADHVWLAPVKAASDRAKVELLVELGTLDREFVMDVLAVDMTNPALSKTRCELLRLVPKSATDWRASFAKALATSSLVGARELATNLTDPKRTADAHRARAQSILAACRKSLGDAKRAGTLVELLAQRRAEIAASDISKHPRGQILEPGFRVVFPTTNPAAIPYRLQLTDSCDAR